MAGIKLAQMQQDDLLSDDIDLFEAKPTSIFTDAKGHKAKSSLKRAHLLWLASIYGDDLGLNNYDTGFATDLHNVAIEIMNDHPRRTSVIVKPFTCGPSRTKRTPSARI